MSEALATGIDYDETDADLQFNIDGDIAAGIRWDPLGEEKTNTDVKSDEGRNEDGFDDGNVLIKNLESEQEVLTVSLQALTSHFAQVQFRLRQIVEAPKDERDTLLQNLEEFAFRGIPQITKLEPEKHEELFKIMERHHHHQSEVIEHLKRQLSDADNFDQKPGTTILPQSILLEKQKLIIDELNQKLKLNVNDDNLPLLSHDDIRLQVHKALGEFVTPMKMKDTLVNQLKTQIVDLERFVDFLQFEDINKIPTENKNVDINFETYNSRTAKTKKQSQSKATDVNSVSRQRRLQLHQQQQQQQPHQQEKNLPSKLYGWLVKGTTLLNIFTSTHMGCQSNIVHKNIIKRTAKENHWGRLRAQLEVDVQEIILLITSANYAAKQSASVYEKRNENSRKTHDYNDSDDSEDTLAISKNLCASDDGSTADVIATQTPPDSNVTRVVRKQFAVTLQNLMQHGLCDNTRNKLVPFVGCMFPIQHEFENGGRYSSRGSDNHQMHAWDLILKYYHSKHGEHFNDTPARKLSESFNLDIFGFASHVSSNKHTMLTVIGSIIRSHTPYKRSLDSHFKAFVCAGLNLQKLTQWLNLIYKSSDLLDVYYADWSYVANTGFRDGLSTIDKLSQYKFNLPVDLAIKQFQNIKDVFM